MVDRATTYHEGLLQQAGSGFDVVAPSRSAPIDW